jgi:fibro-slime domain-containing protein
MKRTALVMLLWGTLGAWLAGAAAVPTSAQASVLTGTYFTIPNDHPDANQGIDGARVPGLVEPALGPSGLPVASAFALTRDPADGSGPITDVNAANEILWWTPTATNGVLFEKTVWADPIPNYSSGFFADGEADNSNVFRSVHWAGYFDLLAPTWVTFTLSADDDAWLFVDRQLAMDNGGVKRLPDVDTVTAFFDAGTYNLDLFFADRHEVESGIVFSADVPLNAWAVPAPASLILFGTALAGLSAVTRLRRSRRVVR